MSVGERIKDLRQQNHISQLQLANALHISRQAVSKWENDLSEPDTLNLIRLADVLSTDSEYLATGKHSTIKSPPTVITMVQKVDNVIEKVVEKPVYIDKVVEVERVIEVDKVVEIPRIKKIVRTRYLRNPVEFVVVGLFCFLVGILIGIII